MNCSFPPTEQNISIPYALEQSKKGLYFIGQTPIFTGTHQYALSSLELPHCTNTNLYVNAIAVTNVSGPSFSVEFFLNSPLLGGPSSNLVSCANTSINPSPLPEGQIHWVPGVATAPSAGTSIFSRIIPPGTTVVIDGGQIIIGSGQSLLLYLGGYLPILNNTIIVAFGWWEECVPRCIGY